MEVDKDSLTTKFGLLMQAEGIEGIAQSFESNTISLR